MPQVNESSWLSISLPLLPHFFFLFSFFFYSPYSFSFLSFYFSSKFSFKSLI